MLSKCVAAQHLITLREITPSSSSFSSSNEATRCEQCDITFTNLQDKEEHRKWSIKKEKTYLSKVTC
jgi:hypothetical protein